MAFMRLTVFTPRLVIKSRLKLNAAIFQGKHKFKEKKEKTKGKVGLVVPAKFMAPTTEVYIARILHKRLHGSAVKKLSR